MTAAGEWVELFMLSYDCNLNTRRERLRQEDCCKFKASLDYIVNSRLRRSLKEQVIEADPSELKVSGCWSQRGSAAMRPVRRPEALACCFP